MRKSSDFLILGVTKVILVFPINENRGPISLVWLDWLCFGFVSFGFILEIYFSGKKMVLINLNAIFQKKFAITSVMNTYTKMC